MNGQFSWLGLVKYIWVKLLHVTYYGQSTWTLGHTLAANPISV